MAVLIVVLSVMNGFEREVRGRIRSLTSRATISAFGSGLGRLGRNMRPKIGENPKVVLSPPTSKRGRY